MARKKEEEVILKTDQVDILANDVLAVINSKFKDLPDKTAHYLDDPNIISDVKEWVSTGSTMLDLAISNRPNGGFPVGRITEIFGAEASGKSLLASHALASTQKKGGLAVYFDTEAAVSREYLQAIGVDTSKLLYINLECLEDIFASIESIIERVRKANKDKIVTIVVDSIMGATTKVELEADYEKDGWATTKAIVLSKAMRKITGMIARQNICLILTNQLRVKLGATFGDTDTTSGGKAVGFHSSVRIKLQSMGQLKGDINGIETPIGVKTKAIVKKNRLGPPLRSIFYDIFFASGIDDYGSWLNFLKELGFLKPSGHSYTYDYVDEETGELITKKFKAKDFEKLLTEISGLKGMIYDQICENFIMKYNTKFDDVIFDENEEIDG